MRFLDQASLDWSKSRNCFTCHTNYLHLVVRPAVGSGSTAEQETRQALEQLVTVRWPDKGPRWNAEVVMTAATLALHDASTTGTLHPATRTALDRMWTVQRPDGGIDWLKRGWPPMESDDDFGVAMFALAAGAAPEEYFRTEAAQAGLGKVKQYLAQHPAPTLHHRAMLVWAGSYLPDLIEPAECDATVHRLLELQRPDGGWNVATLGDWQRGDGQPQDLESSDGYATGFVIYVSRRAGIAADDARLQRGIDWLKANQRESGRWFTRSLNKDNRHFLSHAGTAFALLALTACEPEQRP
mgnify:CR=1 FL=1